MISRGRLALGDPGSAFREFMNATRLEMKSVEEHMESIGALGEDGESRGWARQVPTTAYTILYDR